MWFSCVKSCCYQAITLSLAQTSVLKRLQVQTQNIQTKSLLTLYTTSSIDIVFLLLQLKYHSETRSLEEVWFYHRRSTSDTGVELQLAKHKKSEDSMFGESDSTHHFKIDTQQASRELCVVMHKLSSFYRNKGPRFAVSRAMFNFTWKSRMLDSVFIVTQ